MNPFLSCFPTSFLPFNLWDNLPAKLTEMDSSTARDFQSCDLLLIQAYNDQFKIKAIRLQQTQVTLSTTHDLKGLSAVVVQLSEISTGLEKIQTFVQSKLFKEINDPVDLFASDQLAEKNKDLNECVSSLSSKLIPHLKSAIQDKKSSPELEMLLKNLIKIKTKVLDLNDDQELKNLFVEYRSLMPLGYRQQKVDVDPSLKEKLACLPMILQDAFLRDKELSVPFLDYFITLSEPSQREFLLLLHETIHYLPSDDFPANAWRNTLLQVWISGAKEFVKEAVRERRGYTQQVHPNDEKTSISTFVINYFEEISVLDLSKIERDFSQLREIAEVLPHSFFSHWITDFDSLFALWQTNRDALMAFASGLKQAQNYCGLEKKPEKNNPLNGLLSLYRQDSTLTAKILSYTASQNPQNRQLGHELLENCFLQQIQELLQLFEGMEASDANRFLAFYKQSPGLAEPLISYPHILDALLQSQASALNITLKEIEQAFSEANLSELYKTIYNIVEEVAWETSIILRIENSFEFAEKIYTFIESNYSLETPLTSQDQFIYFLEQIPPKERSFYQSLAQLALSDAQRLLDFLGREQGLRIGIKILAIMREVADQETLFLFLNAHRENLLNLLDFHHIQGSETFNALVKKAAFLDQETVRLILSCYETPPLTIKTMLDAATSTVAIEPWLVFFGSGRRDLLAGPGFEKIDPDYLKQILSEPEKNEEYLKGLKVSPQIQPFVFEKLHKSRLILKLCQFYNNTNFLNMFIILTQEYSDVNQKELILFLVQLLMSLPSKNPNSWKIAQVVCDHATTLNNSQPRMKQYYQFIELWAQKFELAAKLADLYLEGYESEFCTLLEVWKTPEADRDLKTQIFAHLLNRSDSTMGEYLKHLCALKEPEDNRLLKFILTDTDWEYCGHLLLFHSSAPAGLVETLLSFLAIPKARRTSYQQIAEEFLKKNFFKALENFLMQKKLLWDDCLVTLPIRELLLDMQTNKECTLSIQKGIRAILGIQNEGVVLKKLGIVQHLLRHDPGSLTELPTEGYLDTLEECYQSSSSHPEVDFKSKWREFSAKTFEDPLSRESAVETFISSYLSYSLLTGSGGINTALYSEVLKVIFQECALPLDCSFSVYLNFVLSDISEHNAEYNAHFYTVKSPPEQALHLHQLLQASTLPQEGALPEHVAREAILGALLTRNRQSNTGSCFGTQTAISSQSYHKGLLSALIDYKDLIEHGFISRTNANNCSEYPIVIVDRGLFPDRPLARAREYTIAQMSATATETSHPLTVTKNLLSSRSLNNQHDALRTRFEIILKKKYGIRNELQLSQFLSISDLFQKIVPKMAKTVFHPDRVSKNNRKGAWVLTSKETKNAIKTPDEYLLFIQSLLCKLQKKVQTVDFFVKSQIDFSDLFIVEEALGDLSAEIQKDDSFLLDLLSHYSDSKGLSNPIEQYQMMHTLPWINFGGGNTLTVQENYLRKTLKHGLNINSYDPEQTLNTLQESLFQLTEKQKNFLRENPQALFSFSIPGHACSVKLQTLLQMTEANQSIVETLKNEIQTLLQLKISPAIREKLCRVMAYTYPLLSEREAQFLEKMMLLLTCDDSTLKEICGHIRAILVYHLGSNSILDTDSRFEVRLVSALRDQGIYVPAPLPVMDTNWNIKGHSNCYIGYRAGLLSERIMRFIHSDRLGGENSLSRESFTDTKNYSTWHIRAAIFD